MLVANAAVWGMALAMWDGLPERIPLHFNGHGVPDRWGAPTAANWLFMPILGSVMSLLMTVGALSIGALARRVPETVNVPDKLLWMTLGAEARVRSLSALRWLLLWVGVALNFLFGWVLQCTSAVAKGAASSAPWWPIIAFVAFTLAGVVLAMVRTRQLIRMEAAIAGRAS